MTAAAYVARHHAGNAVMADLLDSLTQSRKQLPGISPSPSKRAAYPAHARPSAVDAALSDGSLLQVATQSHSIPLSAFPRGNTTMALKVPCSNRTHMISDMDIRKNLNSLLVSHTPWDLHEPGASHHARTSACCICC